MHDISDIAPILDRSAAPALETRNRATPSADPARPSGNAEIPALVEAIDRQTRVLESRSAPARTVTPVRPATRLPAEARARTSKARALLELRRTTERNERRRDVLDEDQSRRINADMDRVDRDEVASLRREVRELRQRAARPPAQRGAVLPGLSQRNAVFGLYRRAVQNYLRTGQETIEGRHLRELQDACVKLDAKAFNATVSEAGGYFVQPEQDTGPMERLLDDLSPMRQLATVRSISSASFKKHVNKGGSGYRWVGEETPSTTDATPSFAELEFPAATLLAEPQVTQEALEDSMIDVEALLSEEAQFTFAEGESVGFVSGTGVNMPKGFLAYDFVANASWAWGKVGYLATGSDGAFAGTGPADVVLKLPLELKAAFRQRGTWLMNRTTIAAVRTLRASDGHYLWSEGDVSKGVPNSLAGYVVNEDEQMPAIASGSHSMAFGDWARAYLIVDRIGFQAYRNPYVNYPYIKFHMRKRVGGGVQNFEAFKTIKFASS